MQVIRLEDRIIYRAKKGKKVKLVNDKSSYSEIVVKLDNKKQIVEVDA